MADSPHRMRHRAPHDFLGIPPDADEARILHARRELAKRLHPDAGGSVEAMQELNAAVEAALASMSPAEVSEHTRNSSRGRPRPPAPRGVRRDHPSFTIEVLPVVAFESLLLASDMIGCVVEEDPPYLLQATLDGPTPCWTQLELVPDAGSTTVALSVGGLAGGPHVDIDDVRDRWIDALNRLDWTDPASPQLP